MKLDKKTIATGVLFAFIAAGTAVAAIRTTTTTESVTIGTSPSVTVSKTTTDTVVDSSKGKGVVIVQNSPEAELANVIFRILGIPVTINEITVLKTRNMGNGEIALLYNLAHASGRPVNDILNMRFEQKMGWGKIAKTLGVKLHGAADKSVVILREAKLNSDADQFVVSIQVDLDADRDDDNKGKKSGQNPSKYNKDDRDNDDHGKGNNKEHKKH